MVLFSDNTTSKFRPKSALSSSSLPAIVSLLAMASQFDLLGGSNSSSSRTGTAVGETVRLLGGPTKDDGAVDGYWISAVLISLSWMLPSLRKWKNQTAIPPPMSNKKQQQKQKPTPLLRFFLLLSFSNTTLGSQESVSPGLATSSSASIPSTVSATTSSPSIPSTLSATGVIVAGRAILSTPGFAVEAPLAALALALASATLP
mmetsp:Transcript_10097/g.24109  ORF Transcript_10097/g.24109 Transcript_10097/m.24109 type:complete len:203 (+) Transcript_10097:1150-1758(+)